MIEADKTRLVTIDGEEYIEVEQTTELPHGEEVHLPDLAAFTKEQVRMEIESAAERAVEEAVMNGVIHEKYLHKRVTAHASMVDETCNWGHYYTVPYIIHCENQPENIEKKVDFSDLHEALEEIASLCIFSDIETHVKELLRQKAEAGEVKLVSEGEQL